MIASDFQLDDLLKRLGIELRAVIEFCIEDVEILVKRITGRYYCLCTIKFNTCN